MLVGRPADAPDGSGAKLVGLVATHCGSLADGAAAVAPIKAFGPPVMDQMGPISYCAQNGLLDPALPRGALNYWKAHFLTDLSDDAIAALVDAFEACPSPMSQIVIEHFHGAASRVPSTPPPAPCGSRGFNVVIVSQWADPRDTERGVALVPRDVRGAPAVPRRRPLRELPRQRRAGRPGGRGLRAQLCAAARPQDEVRPGELLPHEREHPAGSGTASSRLSKGDGHVGRRVLE